MGIGTPSSQSKIPRPMICIPLYCLRVNARSISWETLLAFEFLIHSCFDSSPVRRFLRRRCRRFGLALAMAAMSALVTSCASGPPAPSAISRDQARGMIERSLPRTVSDRSGWAADMQAAFTTLGIEPTHENVCAIVAVIEQESGFRVDPVIPGLPAMAWREINSRAAHAGVPPLIVHTALQLKSPTGRSYSDRIGQRKNRKGSQRHLRRFHRRRAVGSDAFCGSQPRTHSRADASQYRICRTICGGQTLFVSGEIEHP